MVRQFCTGAHRPASMGTGMKYLHVTERHGRYVAALAETATPTPRRDDAILRVAAAGANRAGSAQIAGRCPPPPAASATRGLAVSHSPWDRAPPRARSAQ